MRQEGELLGWPPREINQGCRATTPTADGATMYDRTPHGASHIAPMPQPLHRAQRTVSPAHVARLPVLLQHDASTSGARQQQPTSPRSPTAGARGASWRSRRSAAFITAISTPPDQQIPPLPLRRRLRKNNAPETAWSPLSHRRSVRTFGITRSGDCYGSADYGSADVCDEPCARA